MALDFDVPTPRGGFGQALAADGTFSASAPSGSIVLQLQVAAGGTTYTATLTGTITPAGALNNQVLPKVPLSGSIAPSGTLVAELKSGIVLTGSITPSGLLDAVKAGGLTASLQPSGDLVNLKITGGSVVISGNIGGNAGSGLCVLQRHPDRTFADQFTDDQIVGKPVPELCILIRHVPQIYQNFKPVPELCTQEGCPTPTFQTLCEEFSYLLTDVFNRDPVTGEPVVDPLTGEPTIVDQVVLPIVYGDFSEGGLRGPIPAVQITPDGLWYAAAAHKVESIDAVYIGDILQTSGYTVFNEAKTAGFDCPLALIHFEQQPTDVVTWRGKGKVTEAGLITNPIEQLEDLLTAYAGFDANRFDQTSLANAKADTADYETAWVVNDHRVVQDWVTEILFNVMGYWRINRLDQIELHVDTGAAPRESDVVADVVAARDCIDGDDGVAWIADKRHLVNALTAYYQAQFSVGTDTYGAVLDKIEEATFDGENAFDAEDPFGTLQTVGEGPFDALSIYAYGEVRKSVSLRGLRREEDVRRWADVLFARQSFRTKVEGAFVSFRFKGSGLFHASVGDLLGFSWPYGPVREAGKLYVNEILRIVSIAHDSLLGGASNVVAVDLGAYRASATFDGALAFNGSEAFGGSRLV